MTQLPTDGPSSPELHAQDPLAYNGDITPLYESETYKQKINLIVGDVLEEKLEADLAAKRDEHIEEKGGFIEARAANIWESLKPKAADTAHQEVIRLLNETPNIDLPEKDKDVFDKIVTSISIDMCGTVEMDDVPAGRDVADLNVGSELEELIVTGQLQNPATLAKAIRTIDLLLAVGQYKLYRWRYNDQLETALGLIEMFSERAEEFSPYDTGFLKVREGLIEALAALQVDQATKPNYQFAEPFRGPLAEQMSHDLKLIHTAQAHISARSRRY